MSLKEKMSDTFGTVGLILYLIIGLAVPVLPFVMINLPFWLSLIAIAFCYFVPVSSVIFWVWGLICTIQGPQDIWAILYYIACVVLFLPSFISTVLDTIDSLLYGRR